MKYRKKPVVIEAWRWDSTIATLKILISEGMQWCSFDTAADGISSPYLRIKTLEGNLQAMHGDYIIKGIQGEFYPCKPDIFEMTYDQVE